MATTQNRPEPLATAESIARQQTRAQHTYALYFLRSLMSTARNDPAAMYILADYLNRAAIDGIPVQEIPAYVLRLFEQDGGGMYGADIRMMPRKPRRH